MKKLLKIMCAASVILLMGGCGGDKEGEATTSASETEKPSLSAMDAPEDDGLDWGDFEVQE